MSIKPETDESAFRPFFPPTYEEYKALKERIEDLETKVQKFIDWIMENAELK